MHVSEIWRFPVKSMAGERLGRAEIGLAGVAGDRLVLVRVGDALIGVLKLRQRCVMTTYDPETLEQDVGVLRGIQRELGGLLALDCFVERGAHISQGDPVELLDS